MKTNKPDFARIIWRMWNKAAREVGAPTETWKSYKERTKETPETKKQADRIYACIAKTASCEVPYLSVLK